jgi:hydroxypyruvate isomerase
MEPLPVPMEDFLSRVKGMGFPAVEIWKPGPDFPQLAEMARKHGLRVASMTGHDSLPVGFNNPAEHPRIVAELRQSIDLAEQYNVPGLICFSGNRRAGQSDAEAIAACVDGLLQIAPYAEEKRINLNMELLNSKINHPGYQCDHAAWGLEVVKQVNSPRVKLLYDIYHMQIMDGDLIHTISENIQWIGHFHTAGVPGRNDLDDTQEINYRAVCRAINATGYDLYLGHEFRPKGELFAALEEAYRICG